MEIKYRLIAEVIKLWRAAPEERALTEALLYMTGLELEEAQKMPVPELADVLSKVIRRSETKAESEQESETEAQEQKEEVELPTVENEEEVDQEKTPETTTESSATTETGTVDTSVTLSFIEQKKLRRGRKPNGQGSVN